MGRYLTLIIFVLLATAGLSACKSERYNFFDPVEGGVNTGGIGGTSKSYDCTSIVPGIDFEDDMICAHNDVREAPPSPEPIPDPPLVALEWSSELARFAESHANNCVYANSKESDRPSSMINGALRPAGESLFAAPTGEYTDRGIVGIWAAANNYSYSANRCDSQWCEEYKQIVWDETYELGCAKTTCRTLVNRDYPGQADFWVCNYRHGGNVPLGRRPYETTQ